MPLVPRYNQPKEEREGEKGEEKKIKNKTKKSPNQRFANLHLTNPNLGNYFVYQTSLIPNDELFFKEKNDPW